MARLQQKSSGSRIKRTPLDSGTIKQALSDSLARGGQPPARWGEYLPRRQRKPPTPPPAP